MNQPESKPDWGVLAGCLAVVLLDGGIVALLVWIAWQMLHRR